MNTLKTINQERESRISFLRQPDNSIVKEFTDTVLNQEDNTTQRRLNDAWDYALSLDYHHPGQSKEVYLAHPMRVAKLYSQVVRPMDVTGVITAMLHNVKEVSDVSDDELLSSVGEDVANAISTLTVEREIQWDAAYKNSYYKKIESSQLFTQRVKILDKLDNLFLLCLNSSEEIRKRYLDEIEKWVLPMTKKSLPELYDYMGEIIINNRRIGYRPL